LASRPESVMTNSAQWSLGGGSGSGTWAVAANWSDDLIPVTGDDVTISGVAGSPAVVITAAGAAGFGTQGALTGAVSLSGPSVVEFASGSITSIAAGASLTLIGNTAFVADAGRTNSNSALTGLAALAATAILELEAGASVTAGGGLDNEGGIDLTANGSALGATLTVQGTLTNNGSLQIGDVNSTVIESVNAITANALSGTGLIVIEGGANAPALLDILTGLAGFSSAGVLNGQVVVGANSLIEFASGSIEDIAVNGRLYLESATGFVADAGHLTTNSALSGLASVEGALSMTGSNLSVIGDLDVSGVYNAQNLAGGLQLASSVLIVGGGLTLSGSASLSHSLLTITGALINDGSTAQFSGDALAVGDASVVSAASLDNTGLLALSGGDATAKVILACAAGTDGSAGVLTGDIQLSDLALLEFSSGSIAAITASAVLLIDGSAAFLANAQNVSSNSALKGLTSNAGELDLEDGASLTTSSGLSNSGYLGLDDSDEGGSAAPDGALVVAGALINTGVDNASTVDGIFIGDAFGYYIGQTTSLSAVSLVNAGEIDVEAGNGDQASLTIAGESSNNGANAEIDVGAGSVATFTGAVSGDGLIDVFGGGVVNLGAGATGGAVAFGAGGGTVTVASGTTLGDAVAGFSAGDALRFTALPYKSSDEINYRSATGVAQIIDTSGGNAVLASLDFSSVLSGETLGLAASGAGGVAVDGVANPLLVVDPGDVVVSNVSGQAYSAVEQVFDDGAFAGTNYFYSNTSGAAYSAEAVETSASGSLVGAKYLYTSVVGQPYGTEQLDVDGAGRATAAVFTDLASAASSPYTYDNYSSYRYDYVGGIFSGSSETITSEPSVVAYSSDELDYSSTGQFAGDRFWFTNVTGQSYNAAEEDFDASGRLSKVVLSGMAPYSSLEEDYNAGVYAGEKVYYTGLAGLPYTGVEVDASATGLLQKAIYSGLTGAGYQSIEEDFSAGALSDAIYGFVGVTGQPYLAYQVEETALNAPLQETLDMNSGGHVVNALASGQTLTSQGDDTMTGSAAGATRFVFSGIYGAGVVTDFYQHETGAAHDTISLPSAEFLSFSAMVATATNVGTNNVEVKAADGDTLTLDNVTKAMLAGLSGDFSFP
jgi:hypothetical protein